VDVAAAVEAGVDDECLLADIAPERLLEYRALAGVVHGAVVDLADPSARE